MNRTKFPKNKFHSEETNFGIKCCVFCDGQSRKMNLSKVNLRTLKMGYELATTHPEGWRELCLYLLPQKLEDSDLISQLLRSGASAREQEAKFAASTGKSRRTFYNYKKRMGLTRQYRIRES